MFRAVTVLRVHVLCCYIGTGTCCVVIVVHVHVLCCDIFTRERVLKHIP
jgi:hypothetical protein